MTPLHSRQEAGLRAPKSRSTNIRPEGLTAHYGGPSPWGAGVDRTSPARFAATCDHARCPTIWRSWQSFHMDANGWVDIAYTSGCCPHGHRYEGRGPGVRTAANGTNDGNLRSHATVYIAGDGDPLTDAARRAFLDEQARLGPLRWDHGDWKPTSCAGSPIRAWKKAGWPAPNQEDDMFDKPDRDTLTAVHWLATAAATDAKEALDIVRRLEVGGVDLDALAVRVADELAERLAPRTAG